MEWQNILLLFFVWFYVAPTLFRVIWQLSSFTGGGRPQVHLRALFQAQAGT